MEGAVNTIPGDGTGPVTADIAFAVASGRPELLFVPTELGTLDQFQAAYRTLKAVLRANALLQQHVTLLGQVIEEYRAAVRHAAAKADDIWLLAQFKEPGVCEGDDDE